MCELLTKECPKCNKQMQLGEYADLFKWDCDHCQITYFPDTDTWCDYEGTVLIPIWTKEDNNERNLS